MTVNPEYGVQDLDANKTVDAEGNQTVDLYIASHGKTKRTGGPYFDDIERENAEKIRAQFEGREPDLDNPPAHAGTVLVPKSALVEPDTDKSHISDTVEVTNEPVSSFVVPPVKDEVDPAQSDWDNDTDKLNALEAGKRYEDLKAEPVKSETDSLEDL